MVFVQSLYGGVVGCSIVRLPVFLFLCFPVVVSPADHERKLNKGRSIVMSRVTAYKHSGTRRYLQDTISSTCANLYKTDVLYVYSHIILTKSSQFIRCY